MRSVLIVAVIALVASACRPRIESERCDAATRRDTGVVMVDYDASPEQPPPPRGAYGRCASSADCSPSDDCDRRFAGGLCVRRCGPGSACGWDGYCLAGHCLRRCAQGERLCSEVRGACSAVSAELDAPRVCMPSCAGESCPRGTQCANNGQCGAAPSASSIGAACAGACDGACLHDGPWGAFPQGYCAGFTRFDADAVFPMGGALPTARCPAGSVMIPGPTEEIGDGVHCFRACAAHEECREGYRCETRFAWLSETPFSTGACVPGTR